MQKDKPAAIRIEIDGTRAKLIVDGTELQDRTSQYTLVHQAGKAPKLYVTFNAIDVSVNGDSFIQIPESIRQFFEKSATSPAATELVGEKELHRPTEITLELDGHPLAKAICDIPQADKA